MWISKWGAVYHVATKTLLICTNWKGKDKFVTGNFLEQFYANEIPEGESATEEVIWSGGPAPKF